MEEIYGDFEEYAESHGFQIYYRDSYLDSRGFSARRNGEELSVGMAPDDLNENQTVVNVSYSKK